MKNSFSLIIFLLPIIALAQQQVISYPGYTSYWNPATKIPDSVIWICRPHTKVADRLPGFHATGGRPDQAIDYAHSGYDKGHNCDAEDENGNTADEYNSFDYANVFPQTPQNNRIVWLGIENQTRTLAAQYGQVRVKVYWSGVSGTLGPDQVTIPTFTIKEIWYTGGHLKYVVPNSTTVNQYPFSHYLVGN